MADDPEAASLIPPCTFPISTWAKKIGQILVARGWGAGHYTQDKNIYAVIPAILSKLPPNMAGLINLKMGIKGVLDFLETWDPPTSTLNDCFQRPVTESLPSVQYRLLNRGF